MRTNARSLTEPIATAILAVLVARTAEAVHWTSLTRARETAAQLEAMGLYLPELLAGAGQAVEWCACCAKAATRLFLVQATTPTGSKVVEGASDRAARRAERRVTEDRRWQTAAWHAWIDLCKWYITLVHGNHGCCVDVCSDACLGAKESSAYHSAAHAC